ncbi:MAG: endolytic transglycosylase MltG [Synergistaceae bacterium]|nr:endolytic transglycosylase MltG [Synergistaceae bacterium]
MQNNSQQTKTLRPKQQAKRRKRNRKVFFLFIFVFLLIWGVIAAGAFSYYYKNPSDFWDGLIPLPEGPKVNVVIEAGMNATQAARAFELQGALEKGTPLQLARWMTKFGIDKKIRAGHYSVVPSDAWNLARQLRTIKPALLKLQILPGLDIFSLADSLASQDSKITPQNFTEALLRDENYPPEMSGVIKLLVDDEFTRAAFLLPETYMLVDRTPDEAVSRAASAWWKQWGGFVNAHKLSAKDLINSAIAASMIEREVLRDSECRVVSGVIKNRLAKNMLLQIDATVVYAWRLAGRKVTRVLNKDLEIESPYNTYRNAGLPPRPICVPGSAAWEGALDPEENDYYYYVARKNGYHYFSKTYNEHLRNIKLARSE